VAAVATAATVTSRRIRLAFALPVLLAVGVWTGPRLAAAAEPASRLVLKNGTVYLLKEPPRISGTRVVFTTIDGTLFSLDESEIASIGSAPAPTPAQKRYDQEDSRNLGAIARQQRDAKGQRAEVAPRPARKATPKPKPTKAPKAKTTRTPAPKPTPHG
jgi:hypothetical protein